MLVVSSDLHSNMTTWSTINDLDTLVAGSFDFRIQHIPMSKKYKIVKKYSEKFKGSGRCSKKYLEKFMGSGRRFYLSVIHSGIRRSSFCDNFCEKDSKWPYIWFYWKFIIKRCFWGSPFDRKFCIRMSFKKSVKIWSILKLLRVTELSAWPPGFKWRFKCHFHFKDV